MTPETSLPSPLPEMTPEKLAEASDAVSGGLHTLRSMLLEGLNKVDSLIERQTFVSRGVAICKEKMSKSAGVVTLTFLSVVLVSWLAAIGVNHLTRGVDMAKSHESTNASVEIAMAHKMMKAGDYEHALIHFNNAVKLGGDATLCLGGAAECCYKLDKLDEALKFCDQLNNQVPNADFANHVRGLVYEQQGKTEEAKKQYRIAARHGNRESVGQLAAMGDK